MGLNIYRVIVYEIHINLNHFSGILHILLNIIMCVIDIRRIDYLSYNYQFDILDREKLIDLINIVPGSRWNALPPVTLTRLASTARQILKPVL